jgi:hypothetical protein
MAFIDELPEQVAYLIRSGSFSEFATLSGAGVPIDTPTYYFPSEDLTTLDVTTGLAYPAKAERARRNPQVGLLIERGPEEPVVSIAGYAAVRDSDIQANLDRYVAETASMLPPGGTWEAMRRATFYWARIFVCITPAHIRWWPNRAALETEQPNSWRAPRGTVYPMSDPAPAGKASAAPEWPNYSWQELAAAALDRKETGYLSVCDAEGFPIPLPVRDVEQTEEGFRVTAPMFAPWSEGTATLSFFGREIFVCQARREASRTVLRVERPLPVSPITPAGGTVPRPDRETRAILADRMEQELGRRSQPAPVVPLDPLPPTTGAKLRMQASAGAQDMMSDARV